MATKQTLQIDALVVLKQLLCQNCIAVCDLGSGAC